MNSMDVETRIATILARLNGVRRYSGGYMALCPAHGDKNVSLSVGRGHEGRVVVKCFMGCSVTEIISALGLPISLLFANAPRMSLPAVRKETVSSTPTTDDERKVRNACGLYKEALSLLGTPGADYLRERGIPTDMAHTNGARYHPRYPYKLKHAPAVVFPVYSGDRSGELVALSARFLEPERDTGGEKQRSAGKLSWGMFGTRGVLNRPEVVMAEAPIDALSLAVAGIPTFATCGVSNLRPFPKLFGGKTIICAFDLDSDPVKQVKIRAAMERLKDEHNGRVVWLKPPGNGLKDWNDVLCNYGSAGLAHYLRQAGVRCNPPVLTWFDHPGADKPASNVVADDAAHNAVESEPTSARESATIPDQPAEPCYCCKSRDWWFQEASRTWVCAKCYPDPRVLRDEWERRISASRTP